MTDETVIEVRSTLVSRNITVLGKRTSIRLEPEMWKALRDISHRENCTIHDLCSLINIRKNKRTSLTAAIRVFLMLYFRASSTEEGHLKAGHGNFENMKIRAGMPASWSAVKRAPALAASVKSVPAMVPGYQTQAEERAA